MLDIEAEGNKNMRNRPSAQEVGFKKCIVPHLQRKKLDCVEYLVYSSENEFKEVEAETIVSAIEKSEIEAPLKVIPANKRINDIVQNEDLEFTKNAPPEEYISKTSVNNEPEEQIADDQTEENDTSPLKADQEPDKNDEEKEEQKTEENIEDGTKPN